MAVKKTIIIDAQTDAAEKSIDNLKKSTDNLNESTEDLTGSLDNLTGGAISGFKGISQSVKKAVTGFKSLRVAIIATGIGALVLGVLSLQKAFTASEDGQNRFAKLMGQIGVVTGNVVDILANLGESIFAAGKALIKLAKGDLKGASAAWGELKTNISEVVDGVKNFGEETKNEIKLAGQLADARAKADKVERRLLVDRAEADRKRAELLEKAVDREQFTTEQRIEFLKEAGRIDQEITQQEIQASQLRLEAKQLENSLGKSTKEDLDEEAQLKANLIQLETARLSKQKEVTSQTIALLNEQRAAEKAIQDEKDAEQAERDALEAQRQAEEDARRKKKADDDKKAADLEKKLNEDVQRAKLQSASQTFGAIAQLAGEGSKIGKAAAIAQATISAVEGTQNAFTTAAKSPITTLFPAYPFIQAGVAAAAGLANIKAIKSTKVGTTTAPTTPTATGGGTTAAAPSIPPAFNIVGASDTNQLAEAIGGQAQQPVKAFVVSNDVSTAQELDRNIVEGASIG
jgi:hypothetical protein